MSNQINKITKRYLIDILNLSFFSESVSWDGVDQFHALPILDQTDNELAGKMELRGALLINKKMKTALRVIVTLSDYHKSFRVNYRLVGLKEKIDTVDGTMYPFEHLKIDVSASDSNVGLKQDSSYSFFVNCGEDTDRFTANLVSFVLSSELIATQDTEVFSDIIESNVLNHPASAGDPHYSPVFSISKLDVDNYLKGY